MKVKLLTYIRGLKIILLVCALGLLLFPIKTSAEMTLQEYNDERVSYIELQDKDVLSQSFVSDVYQLNYLILHLNLQDKTLGDGKMLLELYTDDNVLIASTEKTTEELKGNSNTGLEMLMQTNSFRQKYRIDLKYFGEGQLRFNAGKINKESSISLNGKYVANKSMEVTYMGKKNNYFFAWYPITIFAIVSLIATTIKKGVE